MYLSVFVSSMFDGRIAKHLCPVFMTGLDWWCIVFFGLLWEYRMDPG